MPALRAVKPAIASQAFYCSFVGDSQHMLEILKGIKSTKGVSAVVRLAYCTTRLAFDLLCSQVETKGLEWRGSADQEEAEVFYLADSSWPHEVVSGWFALQYGAQLATITGSVIPGYFQVSCNPEAPPFWLLPVADLSG